MVTNYTILITGEYDFSMGTHVFFHENYDDDDDTDVGKLDTRCENLYKFDSKTNKTLKMNRILLKNNTGSQESMESPTTSNVLQLTSSEEDGLKITKTYGEALNMLLSSNKKPPREITSNDE
jgi:hypothetical protein